MNNKQYLVLVGVGILSSILIGGIVYFVSANMMSQKMVVQIGSDGNALVRGTVGVVTPNSLTIKSWGGEWLINTSSSTKLMPGNSMSQFKVGDFVGVQGTVSQSASWTISATLMRDWTTPTSNNITKDVGSQNNVSAFKKCDISATWGCTPVSQGTPTSINPPPPVCGCIPTCKAGLYLIASHGDGFWPDGSEKGIFDCSKTQVQ